MNEGEEDDAVSAAGGIMEEGDEDESSSLRERIFRNERDNRYLRKDSSERKTFEEVFDNATNIALDQLIRRGALMHLNGIVRSGKEARVYWGVGPDGAPRAVKIYLTASAEFKKRLRYIAGDMRFREMPHSTRAMINLWVQKEYKNLQLAREAGIRVPEPHAFNQNILVMEYIGVPPSAAPTFAEAEVNQTDYRWSIRTIRNLYGKGHLVHADLSEYNIFKVGDEKVLFDMGSAILSSHPESKELLMRDVTNIVRFFKKRGIHVGTPAEIVEEIVS
jgi:RIO kinase 1